MRNLKRALSLVLAVVMVIGLMVVGAGAVSYNDFSDRGEIVNKDAVSMLTTLGIIEGQPDGSYNPAGDVDRAQMAKMISVALTNNEDCDTLYQNVNSGLTDITANWARGYINYCYVRGIIAGRGNNTFDPGANVTGVEAAKMLLAALGYNAEIEGLVGPDWALNTAALAQQLGIFRNFTKDVSEPLNRDDAALLIYNALDVELIQEYRNGYAISYDDHRTILSYVFGVYDNPTPESMALDGSVAAILAATTLWCYWLSPKLITIEGEELVIGRRIGRKAIALSDIIYIEKYDDMGRDIRICGVGGVFGFTGWFKGKQGKYFAYVGDYHNTVMVATKRRKYLVSCDTPDEFVAEVSGRIGNRDSK